jgi:Fe-S-cluster containining protein
MGIYTHGVDHAPTPPGAGNDRHSTSPQEFDCQACGACCVSPYTGEAYVALSDDEATRLRRGQLRVVLQRQGGEPPVFLPRLGAKLNADGTKVCVALGGTVGAACFCRIYAERPSACRQFEAGGRACREARRMMAGAA